MRFSDLAIGQLFYWDKHQFKKAHEVGLQNAIRLPDGESYHFTPGEPVLLVPDEECNKLWNREESNNDLRIIYGYHTQGYYYLCIYTDRDSVSHVDMTEQNFTQEQMLNVARELGFNITFTREDQDVI